MTSPSIWWTNSCSSWLGMIEQEEVKLVGSWYWITQSIATGFCILYQHSIPVVISFLFLCMLAALVHQHLTLPRSFFPTKNSARIEVIDRSFIQCASGHCLLNLRKRHHFGNKHHFQVSNRSIVKVSLPWLLALSLSLSLFPHVLPFQPSNDSKASIVFAG